MRVFSLIKLFFQSKWRFFLPSKKKVLIYDKADSDLLFKFIKQDDCGILYSRFEEINIPILFFAILDLGKNRLSRKYVYKYIKYVNPKVIITYTDTNWSFYELKKSFKKITTISIQNGYRRSFQHLKNANVQHEDLAVDYLFVMDKTHKEQYSKLIKGNIVVSGSIKNNFVPTKMKQDQLKRLLFISQYQEPKTSVNNFSNSRKEDVWGNKPSDVKFESPEKMNAPNLKLLPMLADYCSENNVRFEICGRSSNYSEELYYKSLIGSKIKNWAFFPKKDIETTYKMIDQASAIVFIDSTLGLEALARKKPIASFSIRGENFDYSSLYNFAFPKKIPDRGPFWTNHLNEAILNEILNLVLNVNEADWKEIYNKYAEEITAYDEGNKKFKNIMKTLNIALVNEN